VTHGVSSGDRVLALVSVVGPVFADIGEAAAVVTSLSP
jgi:hypothetical protein